MLQNYHLLHGVLRRIRFVQTWCKIGKQIINFCEQNNIKVIMASINDQKAIVLLERFIQTIKRKLVFIKETAK